MPIGRFRGGMRAVTGGAFEVTPEIEEVFLSLVRVDRQDRIHPRLARANHLRILHALWSQDAPELLRRLVVHGLVLAVRSPAEDARSRAFLQDKERAAAVVTAIDGSVRLEWIEGVHDIPLQRPDVVAERIERFVREVVG
jgi:hypothetical protein